MKIEVKKIDVAMADRVIAGVCEMASDRYDREINVEWVSYNVYANPQWTSGDAAYTLVDKSVFVDAVIDAMIEAHPEVFAWIPVVSEYAPAIDANLVAVVG